MSSRCPVDFRTETLWRGSVFKALIDTLVGREEAVAQ